MRTLRTLAFLAAGSGFYLLIAGAHVNAYQAALSVPDWPLSYGRLLAADWPGNVFYEQHHRAAAGTTLILFTAVLLWLARRRDLVAARFWGWRAGIALGVQILMGGLIVLALNPAWLSAIHVLVAIVTVALIAATSLALFDSGEREGDHSPGIAVAYRRSRTAIGLVFLLVLLGSLARHPPAGELVFISALMAHLLLALLLLVWLALIALPTLHGARSAAARRWAWLLLAVLVAQLGAGALVFVVAPEPFDEPWPPHPAFPNAHAAHIVLAALVVTCLVAMRMRLRPS